MFVDKVPYYILDLLQQVPFVYVKGLGRFEAIFHPALIDQSNTSIKPPYIEPDFNADEEPATETLAAYMHYLSGIDITEAEEAIQQFVQHVKLSIEEGKPYPIERFGTFSQSDSGNLRFTPDWDAFNLSFSGLEVLDLKTPLENSTPATLNIAPQPVEIAPIQIEEIDISSHDHRKEPEEIKEIHEESKKEEFVDDRVFIDESTSKLWWMILTSALVLIAVLCAYLAWDIISNRHKLDDLKQIYPDTASSASTNDVNSPLDSIPVITDKTSNEEAPITKDSITRTEVSDESSSPCFVVVGAFSDPSNVTKMADRINSMGYASEQIKGGSLTRVAIRTSCDQANLQKVLNEARSSINPEAWIY